MSQCPATPNTKTDLPCVLSNLDNKWSNGLEKNMKEKPVKGSSVELDPYGKTWATSWQSLEACTAEFSPYACSNLTFLHKYLLLVSARVNGAEELFWLTQHGSCVNSLGCMNPKATDSCWQKWLHKLSRAYRKSAKTSFFFHSVAH